MTYVAPGNHVLLDLWECSHLQDMAHIEQAMRDAATLCGANVLAVKLHSFGENAGITGVAILAESHISIHTWPETGYAAIDIFMCGNCNPEQAVPVFEKAFASSKSGIKVISRGKN